MKYWWVNQNKTFKQEVPGGFLWSPKTKSNGHRNQFYVNMCEVSKGDIVFSFCDAQIKAIGLVADVAQSTPKPDFGLAGNQWGDEGWLVPMEFKEFSNPIRPKDYIEEIRPYLPAKYSPLQDSGDGLQSVYLAAIPELMAGVLVSIIGAEFQSALNILNPDVIDLGDQGEKAEEDLKGRTDIGSTVKMALVKSRRGQGIFKTNVRLNESGCRVTGTTDIKHLRASHIKPWSICNDEEKLNGCNGLLLAPHIDHLFDRGFITFHDNGDIQLSPQMNSSLLSEWKVPIAFNVGTFTSAQCGFLAYHRAKVFRVC
jgi:putative restriction endonuclease